MKAQTSTTLNDSPSARILPRLRAVITICLALCTLGPALSASALEHIISFDVPGAGTGSGQGTFSFGMTPAGVITGYDLDANYVFHGFVRAPWGAITIFDVNGAGTDPFYGTQPFSLNPRGEITGYYTDAVGLSHGFVRTPSGAITTFDVNGAGIPVGQPCSPPVICSNGTQGASINAAGAIAGQYVDTSGVFHGFVRTQNGTITTFDAPNAGTGAGQGTFVTFGDGINSEGAISGGYADATGVFHGFVRAPDGNITSFDPSGSVFTDPSGVNAAGKIMGFYADVNSVYHGFVRAKDGYFTTFDVGGAGTGAGQGTEAFNINPPGDIAGVYIDASGVNHGFLRTKNDAITTFDVTGAGTGRGQGTIPVFNNDVDAITGWSIDPSGVAHGFLRTP